jgi:murein DD-endopeptidase MepM/ murein hydrolase activator NlpD
MSRHRTTAAALFVLLAAWALAGTAGAGVPRLIFPIVGATEYSDDFGAPRASGGHQGNDIMAAKRAPVVAVETGRIAKYTRSSNAGCMLYLYGQSGTTYMYIHLNNDKTLRNDNRGGCKNRVAYAPGLRSHQRVRAGQLIAYVGDSGDANGIDSHLHFEVHPNGGRAVSPYKHLRSGYRHLYPRPAVDAFDRLTFRVYGRVAETDLDVVPQRIKIRVTGLRLPNGWSVKPARYLTLSVPPGAVLRRTVEPGTSEPTTLDEFSRDDRVVVWVNEFAETRAAARATAGRHTTRDILLRLRP